MKYEKCKHNVTPDPRPCANCIHRTVIDNFEQIENSPVSFKEYKRTLEPAGYSPGNIIGVVYTLKQLKETFEAGEQNDRKRTKPTIDAARNLVAILGKESIRDNFNEWSKLDNELKQLEQY